MRTRSIIVTQGEMLQSLRQSVPQQLDRIQFWGACGQKLEKYSVIVPKVRIIGGGIDKNNEGRRIWGRSVLKGFQKK